MVPVMYKIAGELLPVVFHVAARQVIPMIAYQMIFWKGWIHSQFNFW